MEKKQTKWLILVSFLVAATALAYTTQQASEGEKQFSKNCAECHGIKGQGGTVPSRFGAYAGMEAPELIGSGALPGFHNAGHVYNFIKSSMPLDEPGSLTEKQNLDITAYLVHANDYAKPDGKPMTPQSASSITFKK